MFYSADSLRQEALVSDTSLTVLPCKQNSGSYSADSLIQEALVSDTSLTVLPCKQNGGASVE